MEHDWSQGFSCLNPKQETKTVHWNIKRLCNLYPTLPKAGYCFRKGNSSITTSQIRHKTTQGHSSMHSFIAQIAREISLGPKIVIHK